MKKVIVFFTVLFVIENAVAFNPISIGGGSYYWADSDGSKSEYPGFSVEYGRADKYNCIKHGIVRPCTCAFCGSDGKPAKLTGCRDCIKEKHDRNIQVLKKKKEKSEMRKNLTAGSKKSKAFDISTVSWKETVKYLPNAFERERLYDSIFEILIKFGCADEELKTKIIDYRTFITTHSGTFGTYSGETSFGEKRQELVWETRDSDCSFYSKLLTFIKQYEIGVFNGFELKNALDTIKRDFEQTDNVCRRCSLAYDGLMRYFGGFDKLLDSEKPRILCQKTYTIIVNSTSQEGTIFPMQHSGRIEVLEITGAWCPDLNTSQTPVNPVKAFDGNRFAPGNGRTTWLVIIPDDVRNNMLLETGLFKQYAILTSLDSRKNEIQHRVNVDSEFRGVRVLLPKLDKYLKCQNDHPDTVGVDFWMPSGNHHIRMNDCNDISNNKGQVSIVVRVSYLTVGGENRVVKQGDDL